MKTDRIILAGGSGFLGKLLGEELVKRGAEVIVLTRRPGKVGSVTEVAWDGRTQGDWAKQLDGARAVFNLAGRSVNCRYTPENRREIIDSRMNSVRAIGESIRRCERPPEVWVQASALAIYGDTGERICDESGVAGDGFPVETCLRWEESFNQMQTRSTRGVVLRIGFVLGREGGALKMLARLTRWGLGGRIGSGRQYISWIHCADMTRLFLASMERPELAGVINATAPNPVTNNEFMGELRAALRRPWSPPAPVWGVRIGAWLMGTDASLALSGRRCISRCLAEHGFSFQFPKLKEALRDLYP